MKKFMYVALAVIALLAFVGCKKDNKQPKSEEKADAYVSFTFNLPQSGFRAGVADKNAGEDYAGTNDEQEIKSVLVVLYGEDGAVKYQLNYGITATNGEAPSGDVVTGATAAQFKTKAKGVLAQNYAMLAFINPTSQVLEATAVGKHAPDAMAAITTTADNLKANGFMMSNDKGFVAINKTDLKEVATEAEAAPVAVNVDRALVKVFVGSTRTGGPEIANGAKFTNIKWQLNTTNTKTYLFRKFGDVVKELNKFEPETQTPNAAYNTRFNRYAEDPNFFKFQHNKTDFTYLKGVADLKNTFGYEDANGEYCLENTMEADEQLHSRTTSFVLSGTWTPANHHDITFNEGETWYSFMGFTFTDTQLQKYLEEIKNNTDPNKKDINGTPAGLMDALKAVLEMNDGNGFTAHCKNLQTPAPPVPGDPGTSLESGTYQNIKVYVKGVCYYQTNLIRHFNDTQSSNPMGYGRYGVVRNNIYKISISKISQPGEPKIIDEGDDDEKDDPDKAFISFDITVNPWIVRTQNISL